MAAMPGVKKPDFPHIIDNTMRTSFISCPQYWYKEFLLGWFPKSINIHLNFGGAFAAGLDAFRKSYWTPGEWHHHFDHAFFTGWLEMTKVYGVDPETETELHLATGKKTYFDLVQSYVAYWQSFPPQTDHAQPHMLNDQPCSEFNFLLPIGINHPQTGEPLLYSGRFDMLANYNGMLMATDEKTTATLGAAWAKQWALRSQFTGYCWAARHFGWDVKGVITRGVSIQKTGTKFAESITYRSQWDIDRWYNQLLRDVQRMIACWQENYYDYNLADACNEFGGCSFREVCDKKDELPWLKQGFTRSVWKPELGKRIPLEEE